MLKLYPLECSYCNGKFQGSYKQMNSQKAAGARTLCSPTCRSAFFSAAKKKPDCATKTCSKCNLEKSTIDYYMNGASLAAVCKSCVCIGGAEYYRKNFEKVAAANAKWRVENSEKIAAYRAEHHQVNQKKSYATRRERLKENPEKWAASQLRYARNAREALTDGYIKGLLCSKDRIPRVLIPQSLVELKRAQIQISNYLKEQAK